MLTLIDNMTRKQSRSTAAIVCQDDHLIIDRLKDRFAVLDDRYAALNALQFAL